MTQASRSTTRKEVRRLAVSVYPAFASQGQHASLAMVSIVLARMQIAATDLVPAKMQW